MCIGSSPKAPAQAPKAPQAAQAPKAPARERGVDNRRRRAAAGGVGAGTILTGSRGTTNDAVTAAKTLLGQ